MKKAVIETGAKQYLVAEGDEISVELLKATTTKVEFVPLLVVDGDKVLVGQPEVKDSKVVAKVIHLTKKQDKVTSIRFKAKKRVHKRHGHRQQKTVLSIASIIV